MLCTSVSTKIPSALREGQIRFVLLEILQQIRMPPAGIRRVPSEIMCHRLILMDRGKDSADI